MQLHGQNFLGSTLSGAGPATIEAFDPARGQSLAPLFHEATDAEIDAALRLAQTAFETYRTLPAARVAAFLDGIAAHIEALGDELLERASAETGLSKERLTGERGRTCNQLRMFAGVVREGSWVEARIDRALPDRKPLPKPDLRRMLRPLGPVAVFGASNFPLAFSVAGGDTASALAAGCSVVVKAHPAHPGTSELTAGAILRAAQEAGMPDGVFSLLHGVRPGVSLAVVRHSLTQAVGFTGSLRAGRALFDAAAARPAPIPVYAEMGSLNPVFVLPGAARERGDGIAAGLHQSVTTGAGQFCTCPGLVVALQNEHLNYLLDRTAALFAQTAPGVMLHPGILRSYGEGVERLRGKAEARGQGIAAATQTTEAAAALFVTPATTFLAHPELSEEVFGPATLVVACQSPQELEAVARGLAGHLTTTIHGTTEDLKEFAGALAILETKSGRLIFNGFPTGVEVCPSMQHGGPYPATTDSRSTSVGTAAITRFARPVCFQNFPQEALPAELQDANPRGLWRLVDNEWSQRGA